MSGLTMGVVAMAASSGQSYLLNDLAATELAAYSSRLLRPDYLGASMRIRRASDNNELDIGFTSAGNLDESAVTAHCSGTQGFLVKLYDQEGSNDSTQATPSRQPEITNSSNVIHKLNGRPVWYNPGTTYWLELTTAAATVRTVGVVIQQDTINGAENDCVWGHASEFHFLGGGTTGWLDTANCPAVTKDGDLSVNGLSGLDPDNEAMTTTAKYAHIVTTGNASVGRISTDRGFNRGANGKIGEWIIWSDALTTSQRDILDASQALYWGI